MDKDTSHFDEIWDESGFLVGYASPITKIDQDLKRDLPGDADRKLMYVSEDAGFPLDLKDSGVS